MGGDNSKLTDEEKYQKFNQDLTQVEAGRVVIAVDFSQSNKHLASGWGKKSPGDSGSLHAQQQVLIDENMVTVQSPYRRALELLTYRIRDFDKFPEGFRFIGFTDKIIVDEYVNNSTVLQKYDELAMQFNNDNLVQSSGTSISPAIYKAIEHSVLTSAYVILIVLTDCDLYDVARATQAITDASRFPVSICALGIGEETAQADVFKQYQMFDDKLFERQFDNFNFSVFKYFKKENETFLPLEMLSKETKTVVPAKTESVVDQNAEKILAMQVFEELRQQYQTIMDLGYKEVVEYIKKDMVSQGTIQE
ncbi:Phospholipid-binding_copine family protein [Hexamita inflata]|uniref:Phospholipid-binding copine family protein n=1 Tax=Hexamita inflata TaxID=28002 RepID=A0AA86PZL3_9EUKA|nr:Phospholipid-binding copine family protein [Hexamita inflata]